MNPIITINGKPFLGVNGQAFTAHEPAAPNDVAFGAVTVAIPDFGPRTFTISQDAPLDAGVTHLKLHIYGSEGESRRAVAWTVPADILATLQTSTGSILLGNEDTIMPGRTDLAIESVRFIPRNAAGSGACPKPALTVEAPTTTAEPTIEAVSITGTAVVGSELTAEASSVIGTPTPTLAYQWYRDGVAIEGATASAYTPTVAGSHVCVATATNTAGAVSVASDPVVVGSIPSVSSVAITGSGFKDTAHSGAFVAAGIPEPTASFQWKMDGSNVGTDADTYTPVANGTLTVTVTVTNEHGSASATSSGKAITTQVSDVAPTISGLTITSAGTVGRKGDVQTASFSVTGLPAPTIAYQWKVDGAAIGGATSASYTPTQESGTLTVTVTATNTAGADSKTSSGITILAPVALNEAAVFGAQRLVLKSMAGDAPAKGAAFTSGSATAKVVGFVPGSGTSDGTVILGTITNGPISDNASCSWANPGGTNGVAAANGASAAKGLTGGEPIYWIDPTWYGVPTNTPAPTWQIADDSAGTGTKTVDLTGSLAPHYGTKYLRATWRATGYGVPASPGYVEYVTGWMQIGIPTLAALADSDWYIETAAEPGGGTRMVAVWVRDSIDPGVVRWTTATQAQIDLNPYPALHELCTRTSTTETTSSTLYRRWTTSDAIYSGKNYTVFTAPGDDARRSNVGLVADAIGGARTPLGNRKTLEYITVPTTTSDVARLILRSEEQFNEGTIGGNGMQYPRGADADGDFVEMAYDVTGPSFSLNFGGDWQTDPAIGLFAMQTTEGVICHDDRWVHMLGGALFMRQVHSTYRGAEGIYRKDRTTGLWTQTLALPDIYGSNGGGMRYNMRRIALVKGSGSSATTRTLFAVYAPSTDGAPTTIQIYKSTNSGASWAADGGTISVATHGNPIALWADATALYMATKTGVSRRPINETTWTRATWPSGTSGVRSWVEKYNGKVYVSIVGEGVYVADDATTLAFSVFKSHNCRTFSICPTNPNRMIITGGGSRAIGTLNGGGTWYTVSDQPFPGAQNLSAHLLQGPPTWVRWHDTDQNRFVCMRSQHMGVGVVESGTTTPFKTAYGSNNQCYSEVKFAACHPTDYRRIFLGMTDRIGVVTDHGAIFVHDDAITADDKETIKSYTGNPGALTGRGGILFARGTRTGYVLQVGDGIGSKTPVVLGRSVATARTDTGDTGNGAISVTASPDLPSGRYVLTCTTAAANGGTFTGVGPEGIALGTWTVGTPRTYTHPRAGTLQITISDGSIDFRAGANPCVFTITVNPIGGSITITNPATKTPAWYGAVNPAVSYRGCSGRHIFEMATDGTITRIGGLSQDFVGFLGSTGNVILCYSGTGTLYRGTSADSGQSYTISQWITGLGNFSGRGIPVVAASSHNDQRAYCGMNNGIVKRIQNGVATNIFNFDTWCDQNGVSTTGVPGVVSGGRNVPPCSGVAESWFDPNLLYASFYTFGANLTLFRTENALASTPAWENITLDSVGRGLHQPVQGMSIHPLTDEVFLFSSHGTVMRRPPAAHRTLYSLPSLVSDLQASPGGDYHRISAI